MKNYPVSHAGFVTPEPKDPRVDVYTHPQDYSHGEDNTDYSRPNNRPRTHAEQPAAADLTADGINYRTPL